MKSSSVIVISIKISLKITIRQPREINTKRDRRMKNFKDLINYLETKRRNKPRPKLKNWGHPIAIIATFFWAGRGPYVPGIWGSIAALPLGWVTMHHFGVTGLMLMILALTVIGTFAAEWVDRKTQTHDASLIVIDEAAGVMIPLLIVPTTGEMWLTGYLLSLFFFGLIDIIKPFPINWVDKRIHGGFGVMVDDVLAGILALGCVYLCLYM